MNHVRTSSTHLIAAASRVQRGARLVPPVRLYGQVKVDETSEIGKYSYLGNGCYLGNAVVGNYCSIARFVEIGARQHPTDMLSSHSFQYAHGHFKGQPGYTHATVPSTLKGAIGKTQVGNDVWLGAKVTVQGGVTVGHGAIIGSAFVVTKDIPPYAVAVGAPARVLRYRFPDALIARLLAVAWWQLEPCDMDGVDFADVEAAVAELELRKAALHAQVTAALSAPLRNEASDSKQGILWFDVERSYAAPEAIEAFEAVDLLDGAGPRAITRAWFDPLHNRFGLRCAGLKGVVGKGKHRFQLLKA